MNTSPYIGYELPITLLGMMIQMANIFFAVKHARRSPTLYNAVICSSMTIYLAAFVPLLISTCVGSVNTNNPSDISIRLAAVATMGYAYNVLLGISTLMYTILIQFRLRAIRKMLNYSKYYVTFIN